MVTLHPVVYDGTSRTDFSKMITLSEHKNNSLFLFNDNIEQQTAFQDYLRTGKSSPFAFRPGSGNSIIRDYNGSYALGIPTGTLTNGGFQSFADLKPYGAVLLTAFKNIERTMLKIVETYGICRVFYSGTDAHGMVSTQLGAGTFDVLTEILVIMTQRLYASANSVNVRVLYGALDRAELSVTEFDASKKATVTPPDITPSQDTAEAFESLESLFDSLEKSLGTKVKYIDLNKPDTPLH